MGERRREGRRKEKTDEVDREGGEEAGGRGEREGKEVVTEICLHRSDSELCRVTHQFFSPCNNLCKFTVRII